MGKTDQEIFFEEVGKNIHHLSIPSQRYFKTIVGKEFPGFRIAEISYQMLKMMQRFERERGITDFSAPILAEEIYFEEKSYGVAMGYLASLGLVENIPERNDSSAYRLTKAGRAM